jgi:hypothetical protein
MCDLFDSVGLVISLAFENASTNVFAGRAKPLVALMLNLASPTRQIRTLVKAAWPLPLGSVQSRWLNMLASEGK